MGLFKKKPKESAEIDRLKSQIESMAAHLAAADQAKQQLGDQVQGIVTRLDAPPEPPPPTVSPAEFSEVQSKLQAVVERVTAPTTPTVDPSQFEAVSAQVLSLTERLETPPEPEPQAPVVDPDQFEAVSATVSTLAERMDGIDAATAQMETIAARIDRLDARITSISNELANQITELSGDIDGLSTNGQPASELVDQLRDTQLKLANEQARYQIAFRQDLAHLADFLKHT